MKKGDASILFAILRDGKLDQVDISRSSGDFELDRAAFDAILRSAPFPALPSGFTGSNMSFRFNFHYNRGPDSCVVDEARWAFNNHRPSSPEEKDVAEFSREYYSEIRLTPVPDCL